MINRSISTMKYQMWHVVCVLFTISVLQGCVLADYWSERETLIDNDRNYGLGATLKLTEKEQRVNDVLMRYKLSEYDAGLKDLDTFLAAQHYFKVKDKIQYSKVFDIIKRIPKGASLHSHDEALVSEDYLFSLTYRDNLYGCIDGDDFKLNFFQKNNISDSCNWKLLGDMRKSDAKFDHFLKSKLTIITDDPDKSYPDINKVWKCFQAIFKSIMGLITYKPVFEDYFYRALKELYDDNIKYMELRGFLPQVYDLEGNIYSQEEVVGIYANVLKRFQRDFPDFFGAKFIYAPSRHIDNSTMDTFVETFRKIKKLYPDFVAGFDLVGQEDMGQPLTAFLSQLIEIKNLGAKFFFHAGETNWYGETDLNLFDAILLNSTRIGHGYAVLKHPLAAKYVKEKQIALEICPISNQVLKLVTDLRNHPGNLLIANGFPVVIASDDPSFWGAKGLSDDWYMAFMGMTSRETDLRFLKQLAINSIVYSSLDDIQKNAALSLWQNDWNVFIENMLIRFRHRN
ncbi:adenosine deaminase 2-like [Diabrotica undecimpunctata]|uniref:adenosine deaminase 2-like n=1 Tax=Diabrotica undecimpunctata TaxID=50387 RepID=UPI003B638405